MTKISSVVFQSRPLKGEKKKRSVVIKNVCLIWEAQTVHFEKWLCLNEIKWQHKVRSNRKNQLRWKSVWVHKIHKLLSEKSLITNSASYVFPVLKFYCDYTVSFVYGPFEQKNIYSTKSKTQILTPHI